MPGRTPHFPALPEGRHGCVTELLPKGLSGPRSGLFARMSPKAEGEQRRPAARDTPLDGRSPLQQPEINLSDKAALAPT